MRSMVKNCRIVFGRQQPQMPASKPKCGGRGRQQHAQLDARMGVDTAPDFDSHDSLAGFIVGCGRYTVCLIT